MPPLLVGLLLFGPAFALAAAPLPEGRWEGAIHIPGRELALVVDLAPRATGAWAGSLIVPGAGVTGAPLANIVVGESGIAFDAGRSLRAATGGPATFKARMSAAGAMTGEFTQAGNVATFSLSRSGPAQVEASSTSTPVRSDVEAEWTGEFEQRGYPWHVTIAFENHAGGPATAKFVIVGKRTNDLPVDLVTDEGGLLRIESQANRVAFEGRYVAQTREIRGAIDLGATEVPIVLRRAPGRAP